MTPRTPPAAPTLRRRTTSRGAAAPPWGHGCQREARPQPRPAPRGPPGAPHSRCCPTRSPAPSPRASRPPAGGATGQARRAATTRAVGETRVHTRLHSPGGHRRCDCPRRQCRSRRCQARRPPGTLSRSSPCPLLLWRRRRGEVGAAPVPKTLPPAPPDLQAPRAPGCRIFTGRWSTPPCPQRCAREPNLDSNIADVGRARARGLRALRRLSSGPAPRAAADTEGRPPRTARSPSPGQRPRRQGERGGTGPRGAETRSGEAVRAAQSPSRPGVDGVDAQPPRRSHARPPRPGVLGSGGPYPSAEAGSTESPPLTSGAARWGAPSKRARAAKARAR